MLRMAVPLALAELGWMAMGLEDTIMAGRLARPRWEPAAWARCCSIPSPSVAPVFFWNGYAGGAGARRTDAVDCRRTLVNVSG